MMDHQTTRATCARARGDEALAVRAVRVPPRQGRTPFALVDVEVDGVPVTFAYAALRRGVWELRSPAGPNDDAAFIANDDLFDRVQVMVFEAVQADPAAAEHVRTWRKRRLLGG